MDDIYKYSLIRVVPDPRRGEWLNAGLAVFLDQSIDVRLLPDVTKLRCIAPSLDRRLIDDLAPGWNAFCEGMESAEERQRALSRLSFAHASGLATFAASRETYEPTVQSIMRDLVIPPAARRLRYMPPESRLQTTLKRIFRKQNVLGRFESDIDSHLIVPNFLIDEGARAHADFALKNGVLRVTETMDFRVSPEQIKQAKHNQGALKSITLDLARKKFKKCHTSVVYATNPGTEELIQPTIRMMSDYAQTLYHYNDPKDFDAYLHAMLKGSGLRMDLPRPN